MDTLVAALDSMIEGNMARVGDIIFGRYTALTEAIVPEGHKQGIRMTNRRTFVSEKAWNE